MRLSSILSLLRCKRGTAAIEFTMVFPFMLIVLMGGVVAMDTFQQDRDVTNAAITAADLMSRFSKMSATDRDSVLRSAEVLATDRNQTIKVRIANIINISGKYKVAWSRSKNWTPLRNTDLANIKLPTLREYDTILYTEVETRYVPPITLDFFPTMNISYIALRRPLLVDYVDIAD